MRRELLNTLYVTTPGAFAKLDGDTVRVDADNVKLLQAPLLHLGALVFFGGASLSVPLMHRCAEDGREVTFLDFAGRFKCRLVGPTSGNVLLRKAQYEAASDPARCVDIARAIVAAKIKNSRRTLLRAARETQDANRAALLNEQAAFMAAYSETLPDVTTLDEIRGLEGQAASCYFAAFGAMITEKRADFSFETRSRRPPRDRVNALLSFIYTLLTHDCVGAAEGVGLDPQFGFLHALRPGRPALALDLVEEFRSCVGDRLVLTLINTGQVRAAHFEARPGGSVLLTADGRRIVLAAYQSRKQEEVDHPLLKAKTPIGLIPHLQARLFARHLRGDMPDYLPFVSR